MIRPKKPCIEWFTKWEDLYEDKYDGIYAKANGEIDSETTKAVCKNCTWNKACFDFDINAFDGDNPTTCK